MHRALRRIAAAGARRVDIAIDQVDRLPRKTIVPLTVVWGALNRDLSIEKAEVRLALGFEAEGNLFNARGTGRAILRFKLMLRPMLPAGASISDRLRLLRIGSQRAVAVVRTPAACTSPVPPGIACFEPGPNQTQALEKLQNDQRDDQRPVRMVRQLVPLADGRGWLRTLAGGRIGSNSAGIEAPALPT